MKFTFFDIWFGNLMRQYLTLPSTPNKNSTCTHCTVGKRLSTFLSKIKQVFFFNFWSTICVAKHLNTRAATQGHGKKGRNDRTSYGPLPRLELQLELSSNITFVLCHVWVAFQRKPWWHSMKIRGLFYKGFQTKSSTNKFIYKELQSSRRH